MVIAKCHKLSPRDVASEIATQSIPDICQKVDVAGPGFINFYLSEKFYADSLLRAYSIDDIQKPIQQVLVPQLLQKLLPSQLAYYFLLMNITPRSAANLERSGKFVRQQRLVSR